MVGNAASQRGHAPVRPITRGRGATRRCWGPGRTIGKKKVVDAVPGWCRRREMGGPDGRRADNGRAETDAQRCAAGRGVS